MDQHHLNNSYSASHAPPNINNVAVPDTPNTSGVTIVAPPSPTTNAAAAAATSGGGAGGTGIPLWLKRLRRIDRSLSTALEASTTARQQSALGFPDDGDDDLFTFDRSNSSSNNMVSRGNNLQRGGSSSSGRSLPLVSPHANSSPQHQPAAPAADDEHAAAAAGAASSSTSVEPAPRPPPPPVTSLSNAHHNEKGEVTVTFPASSSVAAAGGGKKQQHHHGNNNKLGATIPIASVSACVICRATPREVSNLEEEVARLRAFVTVQRESFQMQLDDIRENHAIEMKQTTEGAQMDLNERLVAYMREVEELKKHLAMAEGVVVQFAKLKEQHTDLSRRYEMLLAASTRHGGGGAAAAAAADASSSPAAQTPADQKSHRSLSQLQQHGGGGAAAAADWELEKMEMMAELEHWKRQAVVAGVAAKTAVGAHLDSRSSHHSSSQSPPVAEPLAPPQPRHQQPPVHLSRAAAASSSSAANSQHQNTAASGNYQRPEPTYTSSLPDAMTRLEAWRKEVNPGHSSRITQQQQQQQRSSVSASQPRVGVDVSPSTVVQTPNKSVQRRSHQHNVEVTSSGGASSSGSLFTGASSTGDGGGAVSERNRWMKLMENIVGGSK